MKHNVKEVMAIAGRSISFRPGGMELTATVEMGRYLPYVRIKHRKVSVGIDAKWCPSGRTITGKGSVKHQF